MNIDTPLGLPHKTIEGHKAGVNSLCYCPENKLLLTITQDKCLNLWQHTNNDFSPLVSYELPGEPKSLAWDAKQRLAIVGFTDGKIKVLQLIEAVIELFSVECGEEEVIFVGYDEYTSCVIGVSEIGNMLLLHMPSAVSRLSPLDEAGDLLAATYDKEHGYVIVGGFNRTISIYDLFPNKLATLDEHGGSIRALHYTEGMLFASDYDGIITAWSIANLSNPAVIFKYQFHQKPVKSLAWSYNLNTLMSAEDVILGADVTKLEDVPIFFGEHQGGSNCLWWDDEEMLLFSGGPDRRVKVWKMGPVETVKPRFSPSVRRKVSITELLKTDLLAFTKRGDSKRVSDLVNKVGVPTDATSLEGDTVLHVAARHVEKALILSLLSAKHQPNPNAQNILGRTPLHEAVSKPIAETLIQHGATPSLRLTDREGSTVLHAALKKHGNVDLIKYYIQLGVDPNQRDNTGRTALDWALMHNKNLAHADCLLRNGSNADLQDSHGNSILHNLVLLKAEARDALNLLLKFKVNINLQNNRGNTPLHLAAALDYEPTVSVLLASGASAIIQNKDGKYPYEVADTPQIYKLISNAIHNAAPSRFTSYLLKDSAKPATLPATALQPPSVVADKSKPVDEYTKCLEKLVSKIWGRQLQQMKLEELEEAAKLHEDALNMIRAAQEKLTKDSSAQ